LTDISVHTLFAYLTSSLLHPLPSGTTSYSHVTTSSEDSPTTTSVEGQYRQTKAKRRKSAPREEVEMASMDNER
jgi:hypothetical protein